MDHQQESRQALVRTARGLDVADRLFRNARVFNPFNGEWEKTDFGVRDGIVCGRETSRARETVDLKGKQVIPGLIDSHVHIESSLLCLPEYARLVAAHGTTTVIADPHEIANVCGEAGIRFFLSQRDGLPVDLFIMVPSSVPATPADVGGAVLEAPDLERFCGTEGVIGLGEVMNVPGVLNGDPAVFRKLELFPIIDGHAPLLTGADLSAYIAAGIESDHESCGTDEVREKVGKGMFIYVREGSTERNIAAIVPAINPGTACRYSFATDDRHVDLLVEAGHIDDCVRKAIAAGLEEEIALRMATLSAAERFGLADRGALTPGKIADFCILAPGREIRVGKTFRRGREIPVERSGTPILIGGSFNTSAPKPQDIRITGSGTARVISLVRGQIVTESLMYDIPPGGIPDIDRDILKVVVCNRYRPGRISAGLVHGFGFSTGAIAGSVSHDAHNIVSVGVEDEAICRAVSCVIDDNGGLVVVSPREIARLPLPVAGLMSDAPYEQVYEEFKHLERVASDIGGIAHAFMYLSFLALTVIPDIRITDRGMFDVRAFTDISLFC